MATSGESLAITVGIYTVILIIVFLLFSWWRNLPITRKFFSPKRYIQEDGFQRPPEIRPGFGSWVPQVLRMSEAEVVRCAGIDAALYLKILRMGLELFCIISLVVLIIILPINATGTEVDKLMASPGGGSALATNPLVYWVPPAPEGQSSEPEENIITPPDFYADAGPAPPGMAWWKYADDVPPLPTPEEYLGASYAQYGWRWDASYQEVKYSFSDLDKTTISNIPASSPRLWAHAVITWVVTFITYAWLWKYNKEALRLRIFYLLNQPAGAESHTVLCQDVPSVAYGTIPNRADGTLLKFIPKSIKEKAFKQTAMLAARTKSAAGLAARTAGSATTVVPLGYSKGESDADNAAAAAAMSSDLLSVDATTGRWEMRDAWAEAVAETIDKDGDVEAMVDSVFRRIYQEDLLAVHMCHNTSKLDPLVAQYEAVKLAMTDLVDNYISLKRRGKTVKAKQVTVIGLKMGAWGKEKYGAKPKKVDALEFYRDRLTELRRQIIEEQGVALEHDHVYPAAFVTFKNRTNQVVAARTLMSEDLSAWRCQAAPRAEEVVWSNLGYRVWERAGRRLAMAAAFVAMAAFFMIPVTAVQGLLSMNSFLDFLNSIPIAGAFVTSILPGLALKIFLIIVPIVLAIMNKFSGMVSRSQIDLGVVSRYFTFQVITVFLGSFIAGTFANQLDQFISDPGSIITIFGTSAPQTAIFFMTYLLLAGFLGTATTLLRVIPLIIFWVKTKFLASTERAKARLWQNQTQTYGTLLPNDTIAILLGLVFCVICPLIAPIAAFYFAMSYTVWKHQMLYVFNPSYQSGGQAWVRVFDQCMVGVVFLHLLMVGLLGVKQSIGAPIFVFILFFFDIVFWFAVHARFWRPQECLSLISAADIDHKEAALKGDALATAKAVDSIVRERYLSPSFKFSEEEHSKVMDEASRMSAVLAGGTDEALLAPEPSSVTDDLEAGKGVSTSQAESNLNLGQQLQQQQPRKAEGPPVVEEGEGSFHSARGGNGPASLARSSFVSAASTRDDASDASGPITARTNNP